MNLSLLRKVTKKHILHLTFDTQLPKHYMFRFSTDDTDDRDLWPAVESKLGLLPKYVEDDLRTYPSAVKFSFSNFEKLYFVTSSGDYYVHNVLLELKDQPL